MAGVGEFVYDGDTGQLTRADIEVDGTLEVDSTLLDALNAGHTVQLTTTGGEELSLRIAVSVPPDSDIRRVDTPAPAYPAQAAAQDQGGRILLKVKVDELGRAADIEVEASEPAGVFDAAAVAAVQDWRFRPAIRDGKPIESWVRCRSASLRWRLGGILRSGTVRKPAGKPGNQRQLRCPPTVERQPTHS